MPRPSTLQKGHEMDQEWIVKLQRTETVYVWAANEQEAKFRARARYGGLVFGAEPADQALNLTEFFSGTSLAEREMC